MPVNSRWDLIRGFKGLMNPIHATKPAFSTHSADPQTVVLAILKFEVTTIYLITAVG